MLRVEAAGRVRSVYRDVLVNERGIIRMRKEKNQMTRRAGCEHESSRAHDLWRSCYGPRTGASARHNGVFWLDEEEQMKDYLHVGGRRSLKKIGKDEPM
jgi:hypothetical protein